MTIRALTGFNQETINQFGKPYSPVNGVVSLGSIQAPKAPEYESKTGIEINTNTLFIIAGGLLIYSLLK